MGAHLAYYFTKFNQVLKKNGKVLYCGPSNKAVDVVAGNLNGGKTAFILLTAIDLQRSWFVLFVFIPSTVLL